MPRPFRIEATAACTFWEGPATTTFFLVLGKCPLELARMVLAGST